MTVTIPYQERLLQKCRKAKAGFRVQGRESNCQIVKVLYIQQTLPPEP